jgi:hypothetical protein
MSCLAVLCSTLYALFFCSIFPAFLHYASCLSCSYTRTVHVLSFCSVCPIFTVYVLLVLQFMSCWSDSFDECNNIWRKLKIFIPFVVQLSPSSRHCRVDLLFPAACSGTFCVYIPPYWMLRKPYGRFNFSNGISLGIIVFLWRIVILRIFFSLIIFTEFKNNKPGNVRIM